MKFDVSGNRRTGDRPVASVVAPECSASGAASRRLTRGHLRTTDLREVVKARRLKPPLTASAHDVPESHDGSAAFTFELRFSETPKDGFSYRTLRDHVFTVTGGTVTKARRLETGKNVRWEITVQPSGNADVTVALPVTTDCSGQGAICAGDGRKLSSALEITVSGPDG